MLCSCKAPGACHSQIPSCTQKRGCRHRLEWEPVAAVVLELVAVQVRVVWGQTDMGMRAGRTVGT